MQVRTGGTLPSTPLRCTPGVVIGVLGNSIASCNGRWLETLAARPLLLGEQDAAKSRAPPRGELHTAPDALTKLIAIEFISLDGVTRAPGEHDREPSGRFTPQRHRW
jgi:hypothetical protein